MTEQVRELREKIYLGKLDKKPKEDKRPEYKTHVHPACVPEDERGKMYSLNGMSYHWMFN